MGSAWGPTAPPSHLAAGSRQVAGSPYCWQAPGGLPDNRQCRSSSREDLFPILQSWTHLPLPSASPQPGLLASNTPILRSLSCSPIFHDPTLPPHLLPPTFCLLHQALPPEATAHLPCRLSPNGLSAFHLALHSHGSRIPSPLSYLSPHLLSTPTFSKAQLNASNSSRQPSPTMLDPAPSTSVLCMPQSYRVTVSRGYHRRASPLPAFA